MKYQLLLLLSVLITFVSTAQPREVKLIKKKKFAKLESSLAKDFSKNPQSYNGYYVKGLLHNQKVYDKFDPEVAYTSFNNALLAFYQLEEKEREKFINKGISKDSVLHHRNISCDLGLEIASNTHTIDSYQHFIDFYTQGFKQKDVAILRRDELAFAEAKATNTEESYIYFLQTYPNAVQKQQAIVLRDECAFEVAKKKENSKFILDFLRKYPDTHLRDQAEFEKNRLFFKEQTDGTIDGYIRFCSKNEASVFYDQAIDSLISMSLHYRDSKGLKFLVIHKDKIDDYTAFQDKLMDLYLFDGSLNTYNYFNREFAYYLDRQHKNRLDTFGSNLAGVDKLFLKIGVTDYNQYDYEDFIQRSAPNDIAYVALQRLIEKSVKAKNWAEAIAQLQRFESLFNYKQQNKVTDLIKILERQGAAVAVKGLKGVNTVTDEYAPVPSIDGKKLFFCGKDRKDNYGGEDIFFAVMQKQQFLNPKIESSLSTDYGNEAPLSVSADGNSIFLWSNQNWGDIMISSIQSDGSWSSPVSLPSPINTKYYEGDAMLSADGRTLIFVSSRPGGMNLYTENTMEYHGDDNYPTDIYISHLLKNGKWSEPINLGDQVNTPYTERSPYLHPDGKTLYFSSDGHPGVGRMDVFKTTLQDEKDIRSWSKPLNLGKEINTNGNDWGFKFSTDGEHVYYAAKNQTVAPSSLALLLDVSGSMDGSKIIELRKAAKEVCLNALENNTEVSIIAFSGECDDPIKDWREFTMDAKELTEFIDDLDAYGGTPMYEALFVTSEYVKNNSAAGNKNKSIILMSDGDAASCNSSLQKLFKEMRAKKVMNKVFTIALEVDEYSKAYEDLQLIAQTTGGEFFHAESYNDLGNAFAQASNKIFNFSMRQSNSDIFQFELPADLRPQVVSTISGTIADVNHKPIEASMLWEDLNTGEVIGQAKSNPVDGSYFIVLPVGKNYGYFVDHPDYFPAANNVDLRNQKTMEEIKVNVEVVSYDEMVNGRSVVIKNLFFETAKYDLKPESFNELNRVAEILKRSKMEGLKIEISGHTDNVGEEKYNQTLSENRANAVAKYLASKGVDANMMIIEGYGYSKPVAENNSDANRALNRRVELRLTK